MQIAERLPFVVRPRARRHRRLNWRRILTAYAFLAPYLIVLGVFTLIAVLYAFYLSFYRVNLGIEAPVFRGLKNYQNIWFDLTHDGDFKVGLINGVKYTVGVVILQTVLGLALAVLLNQRIRARGFFRTLFYLPALTSSVAISLIFLWLYTPDGAINRLFGVFGIQGPNWLHDPLTALPAIMLLNIWTTAPTFMIIYLAALQDIPPTLSEAARVDGANGWQVFRHVTLPLLRPTTFLVVALGTIGAFQVFDQIYLMEGAEGGPLRSTLTPVVNIYNTAFRSSLFGLACAEAFVLFVVIFAFTIVQRRFIDANIQY
jgi:multiple sugar transport system permease protein